MKEELKMCNGNIEKGYDEKQLACTLSRHCIIQII
jgi:hypothetical protein